MKHLANLNERYQREVAWDIEARNWSDIRMICAVSSDGSEVTAGSFREFEKDCLALGWLDGRTRFWAHWGGIYDHRLALPALLPRWQISRGSYTPGSGVWSLNLKTYHRRKSVSWMMRDSARVLTDSLKAVGKAFDLPKLEVDRGRIDELTDEECEIYCKRDCDIVLRGILETRRVWREIGGELRDTIAGIAAALIRHTVIPPDCWEWDQEQDKQVSRAYFGGRVEVFQKETGPGQYYDINSSYPFAMLGQLPTRLDSVHAGAPRKRDGLAIVTADIEIPESVPFGLLPYKPTTGALKNRLTFPAGKWRGTYTWEELQAAEEHGARITPIRSYEYETDNFLAPFMAHWYRVRKTTKSGALKYIAKLAMNAISGKMIERDDHQELTQSVYRLASVLEPDREEFDTEEEWLDECAVRKARWPGITQYMIRRGEKYIPMWEITEKRAGALRHGAAAAHVTARGRIKLLHAMYQCHMRGGFVAYCDTDSVITNATLPTGEELGEWKEELAFDRGAFLAPKVYALFGTNPLDDKTGASVKVKAKGFRIERLKADSDIARMERDEAITEPIDQRLSKAWEVITSGRPFHYETTRGFKTGLAYGDIEFSRVQVTRQFQFGIDKRKFSGSTSEPWTVKELLSLTPFRKETRNDGTQGKKEEQVKPERRISKVRKPPRKEPDGDGER